MSHIGEFVRRRSTTEASPRFCLAAVFVIMLWRSFASAAPMTANLRGVVRDAAGGGLPGAAVLVQRWEWEGSVKPTPRLVTMPLIYTDGEGRFSAYLPPGLYDVLVSHAVMEPVSKKIKIEPGKLATFECQVQPSGHVALRHPQSNENGRYQRGEALTENKALSAYFQGSILAETVKN